MNTFLSFNNNNTPAQAATTKKEDDDTTSQTSKMSINDSTTTRRGSTASSVPASPSSSSYYKMNIDSDDARSTSSCSSKLPSSSSALPVGGEKIVQQQGPFINHWATNIREETRNILYPPTSITPTTATYDIPLPLLPPVQHKKIPQQQQQQQRAYDFRERRGGGGDPERRSVNRRNSLLPKSKALLRVIDQADEDTHLADLEMRREHGTTAQLNNSHNTIQQDVPAASWTKVSDPTMTLYQCSKLNPELEMTNFQLESIASTSNHKSIKRKASEDRFEPYPTSLSLKRRAVSPSVSLNGSPILTVISSPPTSYYTTKDSSSPSSSSSSISSSNANAAARAHKKTSNFNLHDASGGLSRMSLSE